ncbi:hypothetical protein HOF78_01030 [Candidatus Woesearchaeota archaeon]|jgi:hypothetical protein|nr:hypothetical protein [Candidatus Woesearchaeota archaeon]MBT6045030.1 hypothetical protein [Candidatus Woesearchaeota archaeon]
MFHRVKKLKPFNQAVFTLMIGFAVVAFWRGAWGIMDVYLIPDNYELSSWVSIIIGLFILWITHYWTKELA